MLARGRGWREPLGLHVLRIPGPSVLRPVSNDAFAAVGIYVTLILHLVPGAPEERLGVLEELPPAAGWFGSERLVRQARYRDRLTNEIVRVDRDTAVKRRRIRREMRAR